ncbi:hypothetical protein Srubr_02140 [Streptomyces rubradiris]|uniref:Uncharacterized protein n=1 Tax=Streptomyces rubradiris TaxID=285531 RepID=A0ABQ3R3H3_STRRR|nr:hypothetical protein GCM10018792_75870 [Streptomyces rubradiris]GHI50368.1 hypothetical protein Srubr_02140 [Streptomyces rubradiris]
MDAAADPVCGIPVPQMFRSACTPAGWLCSTHSPWRAAGLPEPPPAYTPRPQQEEDAR